VPWDPLTTPVDHVLIAGQRSPGIAEIEGFGSPREWDERRGYALSGATQMYRGNRLATGKVLLRFTTPQHWADWDTFRRVVQRAPSGERAHALDIWHPFLEMLEITSVVVLDVKQPRETAPGEWTIEIELREYRRPQVAAAIPDGSQDRAAPNGSPEQQIEALSRQAQELA
jgi:hypothetical protein